VDTQEEGNGHDQTTIPFVTYCAFFLLLSAVFPCAGYDVEIQILWVTSGGDTGSSLNKKHTMSTSGCFAVMSTLPSLQGRVGMRECVCRLSLDMIDHPPLRT